MRWSAGHPLQLVLGPAVWLVWFTLAYSALSVACSVAPPVASGPVGWINGSLLVLTLATAAALGVAAFLTLRSARRMPETAVPRERFVAWVAVGLHAISAASTLALGLPMAWLPPCI
jgi:hypothetical protein